MKNYLPVAATLLVLVSPASAQTINADEFFQVWDTNRDGTVTVQEVGERRSDLFASFDENEDGFLDAIDYAALDEAREDHKTYLASEYCLCEKFATNGMKLEFNDDNKDGVVSLEEFVGNSAQWLYLMDQNADGEFSKADLIDV